ncbi:serine O-acetyltransferase [Amycolatopsis solani]|uniref:serine O-acetyltransferase n=1 Tax=Amycolatopsis solani TaxID=3028615 RepID=UPI0025B00ADA|nr:serine O-acetyltransferase [Amycolatopsis sp. MEP2-6]
MRAFRAVWAADLAAAAGRPVRSPVRVLWLLLSRPGVLAVLLLRVQETLYAHRVLRPGAYLVRGFTHALTGADFVPGCRIGPGLRLEHPGGVVFGAGAVLGPDGFVCQRVTLGERLGDREGHAYPVVGSGVFLGAGATLLGGVRVGDGASVGAGAVVLTDVPPGALAVGVPAHAVPAKPNSEL